MKPAAMVSAGNCSNGVMKNYRRFYQCKRRCSTIRGAAPASGGDTCWGASMPSCGRASSGRSMTLGKAGYWGPQTAKQVDFHFDGKPRSGAGCRHRLADQRRQGRAGQYLSAATPFARKMKERGETRRRDRIDVE